MTDKKLYHGFIISRRSGEEVHSDYFPIGGKDVYDFYIRNGFIIRDDKDREKAPVLESTWLTKPRTLEEITRISREAEQKHKEGLSKIG